MVDLASKILGMRITRDRENRKLWLSQERYIEKVLERFETRGMVGVVDEFKQLRQKGTLTVVCKLVLISVGSASISFSSSSFVGRYLLHIVRPRYSFSIIFPVEKDSNQSILSSQHCSIASFHQSSSFFIQFLVSLPYLSAIKH